jgi:hypothetical protein
MQKEGVSMNKINRVLLPVCLFGGALISLLFSSPVWTAEKEHEHALMEHRVVRIGRVNLFPPTLEISTQDAAMWLNLSSERVEVILDKTVVAHMHCKEPVLFKLAKDGTLRSGKIASFGSAAICSFDPGTYEYTVVRPAVSGSGQVSRIKGTIVVKG